jgi:hypothetical protein
MNRSTLAVFALAALAGCADAPQIDSVIDGTGTEAGYYIYRGDAPDAARHDATVSIHQLSGGSVYVSPFCSGTLIASDWVLTAAHCVQGTSASRLAVYIGDDPSADIVSHLYTASNVYAHSSYSSRTLRNDIALIQLSSDVTESVDPVLPLSSDDALTNADVGDTLNFAGFGYDETGGYGVKQQVDLPLDGLGCTVSSCPSSGDSSTQISYDQNVSRGTGPCSGDSGGPAFFQRDGTWYVAGITSYGDSGCRYYGVSTKVDAFESWIEGYTGDITGGTGGGVDTGTGGGDGGTGSGGDCSAYDESYSGSLSGDGDYDYQPDGTYYFTTATGTHEGELIGPSGADFDLYLYVYNTRTGSWRTVASGTSSTSDETVSYSGRRGYYLWVVESYTGSGSYDFCLTRP